MPADEAEPSPEFESQTGQHNLQAQSLVSGSFMERHDARLTGPGKSKGNIEPITQIETEHDLLSPQSRIHPAYKSLGEDCIRLLKIQQGRHGSPIYCYIQEFAISKAPEYTAVSYTWGSQYGIHEIFINGCWFLVPTNLWRFLTQARRLGGDLSGWLWTDMLSINQRDLEERAQQVVLMSRIFGAARRVFVWLGPEYSGSGAAMLSMVRSENYWRHIPRLTKLWASSTGAFIERLCERAYWSRLWVFQELRLPRAIWLMCGATVIRFEHFEFFMAKSHEFAWSRRSHLAPSPALNMMNLRSKSIDTSLWGLIKATRHLLTSDVRDRVYALLGVVTKGHRGIKADYAVPLPTLVNTVLERFYEAFPPASVSEARESCSFIESILRVTPGTAYIMHGALGLCEPPSDAEVTSCRLGPLGYQISLWWTSFYGHASVQRLLLAEWGCDYFMSDSFDKDRILPGSHSNMTAARRLFTACMKESHALDTSAYPGLGTPRGRCLYILRQMVSAAPTSLLPGIVWLRDLIFGYSRATQSAIKMLFASGGYLGTEDNILVKCLLWYAIAFDIERLLDDLITADILSLQDLNQQRAFLDCTRLGNAQQPGTMHFHEIRAFTYPPTSLLTYMPDEPIKYFMNAIVSRKVIADLPDHTAVLGLPLLSFAVQHWNPGCFKMLLQRGQCDVNVMDNTGRTPLMYCVPQASGVNNVQTLLEFDQCAVNAQDGRGRTALMYAVRRHHLAAIALLLAHDKCDVNLSDCEGQTPLTYAVSQFKWQAAKLLIASQRCKVNVLDKSGWTPLMYALKYEQQLDYDFVQQLKNKSAANINSLGHRGRTQIITAVHSQDPQVVKGLLGFPDCDADITDDQGWAPLTLATSRCLPASNRSGIERAAQFASSHMILESLLESGRVSVNAKDPRGRSSLLIAATNGAAGAVSFLLGSGECNMNLSSNDGHTALSLARALGHTQVVRLLTTASTMRQWRADYAGKRYSLV